VGGQKTLRSYWRNYYEQTDGLLWVVDSSDVRRLQDCKAELHKLLQEEACGPSTHTCREGKRQRRQAERKERERRQARRVAPTQFFSGGLGFPQACAVAMLETLTVRG
jgi:hypothetical protein